MKSPVDHRWKPSSIGFLVLGVLTAVGSSGGLLWFVYKTAATFAAAIERTVG